MIDFTGKHILITGGSSGIGRDTAILLSSLGAQVTIVGRRVDALKETLSQLQGANHEFVQADLTNSNQLHGLVDQISQIDGLVHSAGVIRPFPVKFIEQRHIDEIYKINFDTPVLLTAALLKKKKVKDNASIVFMSSISSRFAHKGGALYSASKAGLNTFSKNIAIEHASKGIRSNCLMAAMVKTDIFIEAEKAVSSEKMAEHGLKYPLGFGEPRDVSNACAFLLSDASRWITGTELVLDGGLSAGE